MIFFSLPSIDRKFILEVTTPPVKPVGYFSVNLIHHQSIDLMDFNQLIELGQIYFTSVLIFIEAQFFVKKIENVGSFTEMVYFLPFFLICVCIKFF
jgi:hypothetical protein